MRKEKESEGADEGLEELKCFAEKAKMEAVKRRKGGI